MAAPSVSVSRSLCDVLQDDIVTGELRLGSKLDEASPSQRFCVSRTLIREALRFLAEPGLVEFIPSRGAFVAEINLPQLSRRSRHFPDRRPAVGAIDLNAYCATMTLRRPFLNILLVLALFTSATFRWRARRISREMRACATSRMRP